MFYNSVFLESFQLCCNSTDSLTKNIRFPFHNLRQPLLWRDKRMLKNSRCYWVSMSAQKQSFRNQEFDESVFNSFSRKSLKCYSQCTSCCFVFFFLSGIQHGPWTFVYFCKRSKLDINFFRFPYTVQNKYFLLSLSSGCSLSSEKWHFRDLLSNRRIFFITSIA